MTTLLLGVLGVLAAAGAAETPPTPAPTFVHWTVFERAGTENRSYAQLGWGTFAECERKCEAVDASLACIRDRGENTFLLENFGIGWFGLYRSSTCGYSYTSRCSASQSSGSQPDSANTNVLRRHWVPSRMDPSRNGYENFATGSFRNEGNDCMVNGDALSYQIASQYGKNRRDPTNRYRVREDGTMDKDWDLYSMRWTPKACDDHRYLGKERGDGLGNEKNHRKFYPDLVDNATGTPVPVRGHRCLCEHGLVPDAHFVAWLAKEKWLEEYDRTPCTARDRSLPPLSVPRSLAPVLSPA